MSRRPLFTWSLVVGLLVAGLPLHELEHSARLPDRTSAPADGPEAHAGGCEHGVPESAETHDCDLCLIGGGPHAMLATAARGGPGLEPVAALAPSAHASGHPIWWSRAHGARAPPA